MSRHHVVVERFCRCAEERGIERVRSFYSREEAMEHAYEWADALNNGFCGKHGFEVVEVDEHFVIAVETGGFVEACEL